MRLMRFTLLLLMLLPPQALAQRYSAGACLLLQQQIDRFASQPRNPNYRSAKREYDKYCYTPQRTAQPVPQPRPVDVVKSTVAQGTVTQDAVVKATPVQAAAAEPTAQTEKLAPQTEQTAEVLPVAAEHAAEQDKPVATPLSAVADAKAAKTAMADTAEQAQTAPKAPVIAALPNAHEDNKDTGIAAGDLLMQIMLNLPLIAANILALLLAVFLLTSWLGLNLPGFKGVFAEYKLNRLLRWRLSGQYLHFRKLKLLTAKDELTVVDHLVLSPYGIFVITVKGNRGSIMGTEGQANWTRKYFGSIKQFMNPLHQNFKNTEAVKHLLQLQSTECLHSVVAFSRLAQFETEMPANITYVDTAAAYLKQFTEPCISDEQFNHYAAVLKQAAQDH